MHQVSFTAVYVWALVTMIVLFLLAVLIANMIQYKPNDPGTTARRIWFWILCALTGALAFVINFSISESALPAYKPSLQMHSGIAAGVAVVLYIIVGFVVSKAFSRSKVGTWF